jgi:hypothetical protein
MKFLIADLVAIAPSALFFADARSPNGSSQYGWSQSSSGLEDLNRVRSRTAPDRDNVACLQFLADCPTCLALNGTLGPISRPFQGQRATRRHHPQTNVSHGEAHSGIDPFQVSLATKFPSVAVAIVFRRFQIEQTRQPSRRCGGSSGSRPPSTWTRGKLRRRAFRFASAASCCALISATLSGRESSRRVSFLHQ